MVWHLLESPEFHTRDLSSIDSCSYGGAAAAVELAVRVQRAFPKCLPAQGYGATETSSVVTANAAEDYMRKPDSVGLPVPVDDIGIFSLEGKMLPAGEIGEIWVRGPNVVKGYWNQPEASAATFTDGWYHTGDVGRIDDEGFLYVLDRIKDMLIRGGENIYCVEIEDALFAHPSILEAAVFGIPDQVLGEVVGAAVRLKPDTHVTEVSLRQHLGHRLPKHKIPVLIDFFSEELPRNANGKTLKNILRERAATLLKQRLSYEQDQPVK
jgi:long-chain acyl-CoA synthetase